MSKGLTEGQEEERVALRRSKRTRKTVIPFKGVSEEESGESETETVVGWNIDEITVCEKSVVEGESEQEGSVYSFGTFSETAFKNYGFEDERVEKVDKEQRPKVVRDRIETEPRKEVKEDSKMSTDSGRGATPEAGLGDFMRMYIDEQRRRDDRREEERREEREQRERERSEAREREERMWQSMNRVAATPEPEQRTKPLLSLPTMKDAEEITEFLPKFEAALQWRKVPRDQWRELLVSHMPIDLLMKIRSQVDDEDSSYEDLVGALSNSSTLTFSAATEDLCTSERGRVWELDGRKAAAKIKSLLGQVTRYADTKPDLIE